MSTARFLTVMRIVQTVVDPVVFCPVFFIIVGITSVMDTLAMPIMKLAYMTP